jgi:predicted small secreted protein
MTAEEVTVNSLFQLRRASIALAVVAASTLGLAACNTVAGAGKDVSNAGSAISNTAQSVQQKM